MRLTLTIENFSRRPDGGPLSYFADGQKSVNIGRNQHLDWCLPDDKHYISGRHCEITPSDGAYFLTDVSTNGTYVNGWENRVQSPYRLRNGDRLFIGDYIIAVTMEGETPSAASAERRGASHDDFWRPINPLPPPIDSESLDPRRLDSPRHVEWIDHVAELPAPIAPAPRGPSDLAPNSASIWGPPPSKADSSSPSSPGRAEASARVWEISPHRGAPTPSSDAWAAPPPPRSASAGAGAPPSVTDLASPQAPASGTDEDAAAGASEYAMFLKAFARALGAPEETFASLGAAEIGAKLGALTRQMTEEMRQLLRARAEAKRLTRSASHTIIEAQGNNPLKFAPTTEDALRMLFGPSHQGYLDSQAAFDQAFVDIKAHQVRTYAAMQEAVRMLSNTLDPAIIGKGAARSSGVAAIVGSRKARLWDCYVARWEAMSPRAGDKLVDAFMRNFADSYDRADAQK
jgi:type VI secretion system protein ImpI